MSVNKEVVGRYMEGFRRSDHATILSCLTEDVVWELPGAFRLVGKAAFDREIENPAFTGKPTIRIDRMVEENSVVVVEGEVQALRSSGGLLVAMFCDVFEMEDGLIRSLTSYLLETPPPHRNTPP